MENAHNTEVDSSDRRSGKSKKRRQPENLGSLAMVSERVEPAPEHIGHMLMAVEAKPSARAGKTALEGSRPVKHNIVPTDSRLANRRVETMSRSELLDLSEQVMLDGSSLHQIYQTHLVGERGLRRLLAEYQHGGDLKKALRQEIVEREIDFERDPAVRDMADYQAASGDHMAGGANRSALNDLLRQAAKTTEDRHEETAFFKARARYEAQELHQHKQHRRLVDFSLAAIILILLLLVILLSMKRL